MIENENLAIDVRQVKRVYGGTVTALAEIDLQIPIGRLVALKGRSASGKTTLMQWRTLYAVYYVTAVEQGRTGIEMAEPTPYRTEGRVQPPLIEQIEEDLRNGRPVFTDNRYNLPQYFYLQRERNGLFRLSLRE